MKQFVVKHENGNVKAMFNTREDARRWVMKNDPWGELIIYPMLVDEDGNMKPTEW